MERKVTENTKRRILPRVLKIAGITVGAVIVLFAALLTGLTLWLTPERLGEILTREASRNVEAEVRVSPVRFTLWSTFPHLTVEGDSISIRSRNFDSIPLGLRQQLPAGADFLMSTRAFRGELNLFALFGGRISLGDVTVDSLRVNLVALSDSLNNYDIIRGSGKSTVPYITACRIDLKAPGRIDYTSVAASTVASVDLDAASLVRQRGKGYKKNDYQMTLNGIVKANSDGLNVLDGYPFHLGGNVSLRFKPFGVSTTDYTISLGEVIGHMAMDIDMDNSVKINNFTYRLDNCTLNDLLNIMPPGSYPLLKRLDADIAVEATARLTSPYNFDSAYLPSLEIDFRVPDGNISYTLSDSERYTLRHIGVDGRFVYDGRDPSASYFDVPNFKVTGEGMDIDIAGRITDLTTEPMVSATIHGRSELASTGHLIKALHPYRLSGDLELEAAVRFRLNEGIFLGSVLSVKVEGDHVGFTDGPYRVTLDGFRAGSTEQYPNPLAMSRVLEDVPLNLSASVKEARFEDRSDTLTLRMAPLRVTANVSRKGEKTLIRKYRGSISGESVTLHTPDVDVNLEGLAVNVSASREKKPVKAAPFREPEIWRADTATLAYAPHSSEFITLKASETLRALMSRWRGYVAVTAKEGRVTSDAFPIENRIRNLEAAASFDSIVLRSLDIRSGATGAHLSASMSNLRQFLTTPGPVPLRVKANVAFDTVQINQLARAFAGSHPEIHDKYPKAKKNSAGHVDDTLSILIPRNLDLDLNATARETRYTNLHLYDLSTHVAVNDGKARVDSLKIGADFGHAWLNLLYDTSDLQSIETALSLGVEDVNVVRFFQNFHSLLEMMPQMKNLSGSLSAQCTGKLLLFPDMYLNVPSIKADIRVQSDSLKVHQNRFIRHVTRMLMLPGHEDLHIADLNVRGVVHDNLLELYPFTFEMSKYRLQMLGLNNFNDNIYYHIGVEKWPLRIPFGINIEGSFHHPKLHFGRESWDSSKGIKIASGVMDYNRINIVSEMRKYAREFIRHAAEYEGE